MARRNSKSDQSSRISRGKPNDVSEISTAAGAGKKGKKGSKKGGKDEHDMTEGTSMMTSHISKPSKGQRQRSKSLADLTDDTSKVESKKDRRKSHSATDITQHSAEKNTKGKKLIKGSHDLSEIKKPSDKKSKRESKSESKAGGKQGDRKKKPKNSGPDLSNANCSCHDCSCRCCEDVRAGVKHRNSSQTHIETVVRINNYDPGATSEPVFRQYDSEGAKRQGGDASEANITVRTNRSSTHVAADSDSDMIVNIRVVFRDSNGSERSLTSVVRTGALGNESAVTKDNLPRRRSSAREMLEDFARRASRASNSSIRTTLAEPPLLEALQEELANMAEMVDEEDIPSKDSLARRKSSSKEHLTRRRSSALAVVSRRPSRVSNSSIRTTLAELPVLDALQNELAVVSEMIDEEDIPSNDNLARRKSSSKEHLTRRRSSAKERWAVVSRRPSRASNSSIRTTLAELPVLDALQNELAVISEMIDEEDIPSNDNLARRKSSSKEHLTRRRSSAKERWAVVPRRASTASNASIRTTMAEVPVLEALKNELAILSEMLDEEDIPSKDNLARRRSSSKGKLTRRRSSAKERVVLEALQNEFANITEMIDAEGIPSLEQVKVSISVPSSSMERGVEVFTDVKEKERSSFARPPERRRSSLSLHPEVQGADSAECQAIAELEALTVHVVKKVKMLKEIHMDNKAMRAAAEREI